MADGDQTTAEVTIDELSAQVGMTVRNIRAHQARGLVPPPRIRGRVGYYGRTHRRRVEQIQAMQAEGLNLAAIAKVLKDGQLTAVTSEVFNAAAPLWFEPTELLDRLGLADGDPAIGRAVELGLIHIDGQRIRMDNPALLEIAEEVLALGVPLAAQLDALAQVQAATDRIARAYLGVADEHLIARVAVDSGGDVAAIRTSVARLGELAHAALATSFDRAMSEALRSFFDSTRQR